MGENEKDPMKAKGGFARAEALSADERRTIASKAALVRWAASRPLKAILKGNFEKDFGFDVDCFVLDDAQKTAVVSQRGMGAALGLGDKGKGLPRFLAGQKVAPYVGDELAEKLSNPLIFQWAPPGTKGITATVYGYDVTLLIDLCKAVLAADANGKLLARHSNVVKQARIILNASAKAGIKGLVYALAGYDPTQDEVIAAFKLYVREEAREYEKEFPDQLYTEWYRLYGLTPPPKNKPWKFKDLTIDHVYIPLAKSNGKILRLTRDHKAASGARSKRLHMFLSEVGVKALRMHLGRLLGMAETSQDRAEYERRVQRVFYGQTDIFDLISPSAQQPPSSR